MITATLTDSAGERIAPVVQSQNLDLLRFHIELFLLPMIGPGDKIEIGDPQ
ncbi:MAG: hypothetical protein K2Y42_06760 [Hyphomicrobium sp.]|uniref:hypothetical protein n=1 Tax=Hyphomicrobium sp. TaxID=82 RepID=UPI0025B9A2C0|nr:hypothetical protein [Hyphomicrobium sp.]MBX9862438.1 hypothetical protein [Hyphomicrobium sp.]